MAGICGIARGGKTARVEQMLSKIAHRGSGGKVVLDLGSATFGAMWPQVQKAALHRFRQEHIVSDETGEGHSARAWIDASRLILERDPLGVAPLYYGNTPDGDLAFASEVKALAEVTRDIRELPPGHRFDGTHLVRQFTLEKLPPLAGDPEPMAGELRRRLENAVTRCLKGGTVGSWLSGGLDSSTIAALARPLVDHLHTFAAGFEQAPDLEYARQVAQYIKSDHHEVIVSVDDLVRVLPTVIYHLESFDALLVRSSVTNYLVAQAAGQYVDQVFSGEGGDELFAGYAYLKDLEPDHLADELILITGALHNTALQRVDRSASAHGTVAHVVFADPEVVDYALRIPVEYKLHDGVEKWILRMAMKGSLPESVLRRTKAKFWEGAGVTDNLARYAEEMITDSDFRSERSLKNGWVLRSKEELFYYRFFVEHFGAIEDLSWMGRSKGAPTGEVS